MYEFAWPMRILSSDLVRSGDSGAASGRIGANTPPETSGDFLSAEVRLGGEGAFVVGAGRACAQAAASGAGDELRSVFSVVLRVSKAGLAGLLAASVLLAAVPVQANSRHAALVVDANTGAVLHADQADEIRFPASLTKMMTLYLAFEAIERGRLSYGSRLKVSHEASSAAPTKLDLDPGETITLLDAMKGLVTKSANDAAIVIAEAIGGTEANFARMMTHKARLIGMTSTTFRNASGLPDPGQVTTARDMIRLALRLHDDFPRHWHLFATRSFAYEGSTYRNHNNLLFRFQGTDGIKTGYTRASGFNLVSSVRRGGRHVVGAIFGGTSAGRRDDAMQLLLARALMKAAPYRTRRSAPVLVAAAEPARRPAAGVPSAPQASPPPAVVAEVAPRPRPILVPPRPRPMAVAEGAAQPTAITPVPAPVPAVRPQTATASTPRPQTPDANQRFAFLPVSPDIAAPAAAPSPGAARGAAPSSFQQQADNLARGQQAVQQGAQPQPPRSMTAPYAVRGPAMPAAAGGAAPAATGPGRFEIQVGAYATLAEAERALQAVRGQAGEVLRGREGRALIARKDSRQIYRARFVGFESTAAASTCLELRRRQIDCFVMREE